MMVSKRVSTTGATQRKTNRRNVRKEKKRSKHADGGTTDKKFSFFNLVIRASAASQSVSAENPPDSCSLSREQDYYKRQDGGDRNKRTPPHILSIIESCLILDFQSLRQCMEKYALRALNRKKDERGKEAESFRSVHLGHVLASPFGEEITTTITSFPA